MLADNSHHLLAAAKRRHNDAQQRAREAIRLAAARGEAVTPPAVATRAGVSRAFLYANPELIEAIHELRDRNRGAHATAGHKSTSETSTSLQRRLEAVTQRNKELRSENHDLRQRLEIAYGQLRAQDQGAK